MPIDPAQLLASVRTRARSAGLLGPAVARAVPPAGAASALAAWLDAGHHGQMGYMARLGTERADPSAWATWARSVALFADSYDVGEPPRVEVHRGVVSRYARGSDYHEVLLDKLRALTALVVESGYRALPFVDTSPLMERALAAAGGLGWVGKNGNLLTRSHGSWVFLGGMVTDAAWKPDDPVPEGCADCTACIPACPTAAIVSPGVIDSRRCISYLTIELKGAIPRELRAGVGNRIFGCDDCQTVCPWNEGHQPGTEPAYAPRPETDSRELLELATLTEQEFFDRFRGSPVRRARWRGLLRNVMVALGNWAEPEAVAGLRHGLVHPEPLVRAHAAWGLGRVAGEEARLLLTARLLSEDDASVRDEIGVALAGRSPNQTSGRNQTEKE